MKTLNFTGSNNFHNKKIIGIFAKSVKYGLWNFHNKLIKIIFVLWKFLHRQITVFMRFSKLIYLNNLNKLFLHKRIRKKIIIFKIRVREVLS